MSRQYNHSSQSSRRSTHREAKARESNAKGEEATEARLHSWWALHVSCQLFSSYSSAFLERTETATMEGDDILGKVRASAKYVKETAEQIHIDSDALHAFVDSLNIGTFEIAK